MMVVLYGILLAIERKPFGRKQDNEYNGVLIMARVVSMTVQWKSRMEQK